MSKWIAARETVVDILLREGFNKIKSEVGKPGYERETYIDTYIDENSNTAIVTPYSSNRTLPIAQQNYIPRVELKDKNRKLLIDTTNASLLASKLGEYFKTDINTPTENALKDLAEDLRSLGETELISKKTMLFIYKGYRFKIKPE